MNHVIMLAPGVLEIVWINIILSVDNAIMIALICQGLPDRQKHLGVFLGGFGAVAMRVVFTLIVAQLLNVPLLRLAGGLFVVYLAAKLPTQAKNSPQIESKRTLFSAIRSIIVADAMMSLDNALALGVAAKGSKLLIIFGLLLSAPLVMFGARILSSLIERLPILIWAGAAILGWAGGELIAGDPTWGLLGLASPSDLWMGAVGGIFVIAAAMMVRRCEQA